MSKKTKNVLYSNVIGACAYYGHNKLLEFKKEGNFFKFRTITIKKMI